MAFAKRSPSAQRLILLLLPAVALIAFVANLTAAPPPTTRPTISGDFSDFVPPPESPPPESPTTMPATVPAQPRPPMVSDFPAAPFARESVPATVPTAPLPADHTKTTPPRTGAYQTTFTKRSDLSALPVVSRRMKWSIEAMTNTRQKLDYDLSNESFEVYVPPAYDGKEPYGLVVWVSFGGGGVVADKTWIDVLNRRKLIWIGPNMAGNSRYWPVRVGLSLDAAANIKSLYRIDEKRVYSAGFSGGGRAASMLGIGFPDVFTGGCYICGCDFYRDVPLAEPGRFWQRNFFPPPQPVFKLAKTNSRHVLVTGEGDTNQDQMECNYKAFINDGFQHVTVFEVPRLGHRTPDAKWFEKAIDALDTLPNPATQPAGPKPKTPGTIASSDPITQETREAESELRSARLYIDAKLFAQARERLGRIIEKYPTTATAAEARKLLEKLNK
jgi:hypothetical protein